MSVNSKSGKSSYEVSVDIQHVNLNDSSLCGYLNIKGLTEDWPSLSTFFEAEIIGTRYPFLTKKWEADERIDRLHWCKFPAFKCIENKLCDGTQLFVFVTADSFKYDIYENSVIYMRWKEHFLVPDHNIKTITGASFAGFYYIAYDKSAATISGLYYHANSEMFQRLSLKHVPVKSFSCKLTHPAKPIHSIRVQIVARKRGDLNLLFGYLNNNTIHIHNRIPP